MDVQRNEFFTKNKGIVFDASPLMRIFSKMRSWGSAQFSS